MNQDCLALNIIKSRIYFDCTSDIECEEVCLWVGFTCADGAFCMQAIQKMSQNRFGPGYGPSYGTSQADESSDSQWMEYESFEHEEVRSTSHLYLYLAMHVNNLKLLHCENTLTHAI